MSADATKIDPRTLAAALRIGTYELSILLSGMATDELATVERYMDFTRAGGAYDLDEFDEGVAKARGYFADALDAYAAYQEDSTDDGSHAA